MIGRIKAKLRAIVPRGLVHRYRRIRYGRTWLDLKGRDPEEVFSSIYKEAAWGSSGPGFYSGPGSDATAAKPYIDAVRRLIDRFQITSVVDIGCGDFRIGSELSRTGIQYHGVDVVPALIDDLRRRYGGPNVLFSRLDATKDVLPQGQLCLIRQVLQHLSNEQVMSVLQKCADYPFVVVTEHIQSLQEGNRSNLDILCGNETRLDIGSSLDIEAPPFGWNIKEVLCDVSLTDGSRIRTMWVTSHN